MTTEGHQELKVLMACLAVIGNISRDHTVHPDGSRTTAGGAALHIALAATAAGLQAAPVAVVGDDLAGLPTDPRLVGLDWSAVATATGPSAAFTLVYDADGDLTDLRAEYGAASCLTEHALRLTEHALRRIEANGDDAYHVCCRKPLDIGRVLNALTDRNAAFSIDFIVSSAQESIAAAAPALPHARVVFVNANEHRCLAAVVPIKAIPAVVVSDGPRPARLFRHGELIASVSPPLTIAVRVTGAGDTLAGAFLAGMATKLPDPTVLRQAVVAASTHTANHTLALH